MILLLLFAAPASAASSTPFGEPVAVTPQGDWGADLKTGDFNADGLPDISVSVGAASSWKDADRPFHLELSLSDGTGGFTHALVPTTMQSGYTLVTDVADLDGDGDADLVAAHAGGFTVFFSDGETLSTSTEYAGARVGPVELGDVDDDGDVDLLTLDDHGDLGLWINDGHGGFTLAQTLPTAGGPVYDYEWDSLDLVDLDGDGAQDLVVTLADPVVAEAGPLTVFLGDGAGRLDPAAYTVGTGLPYPGGVYDLDVGDIDGDGRIDMVFAGMKADVLSIPWDGGFGAVERWPIDSYAYNWVLTGDVDGDGDLDVVGTVGFDLGVLLQDGGELLDSGPDQALAQTSGWAVANDAIELADMNGDGCEDLVAHLYGLGVNISPATSDGCTGAAPTAWGEAPDTGTDTGAEDTGSLDTGADDLGGEDTAAAGMGDDPPEPPTLVCSATGVRSSSLLWLALAGLGLVRRRR